MDDARAQHRGPIGGMKSIVRRLPERTRRPVLAVVTLISIAAVALALSIGFDLATSSPKVCTSCHEMDLRASQWAVSAHSTVSCVECHEPVTEWYQVPSRVSNRAGLLARDISAHRSGDYEDPVDRADPASEPIADAVCLQCHDPNRKATSGFRILIDHPEHAERNGSCISCHVRTAHPLESRGTALSLMAQCFTCHGTAQQPDASAECRVCHPSEFDLVPASHAESQWARGHGEVSDTDESQCTMCHEQTFCDDCHGLAMPHPDDWAGGPEGHAVAAEADRGVCATCHGSSPDLCTMCHHTSFDPMQGTWIVQHNLEVKAEGSSYCEECHSRAYCSFCHTRLVEDDGS